MKFLVPCLLSVLLIACRMHHQDSPMCGVCDTTALATYWHAHQPLPMTDSDFYALSKDDNRLRWFSETEYPDSTFQTRLWDDYHSNNYHTSDIAFKDFYEDKQGVSLAFQIGPTGPLWSYYTFVLSKTMCCHVITRTTFAHARFRYKGYDVLTDSQVDSLLHLINELSHNNPDDYELTSINIAVVNNVAGKVFDTWVAYDMDNTPPDSAIIRLIHYIDKSLEWKETYPLDPIDTIASHRLKTVEEYSILATCIDGVKLTGEIRLELRKPGRLYYTFFLKDSDQQILAGKSGFVRVPDDSLAFDSAREQVIKEIRAVKTNKYARIASIMVGSPRNDYAN